MRTGEHGHAVEVALPLSGGTALMNRYVSASEAPRPESYREDLATAAAVQVPNRRERVLSEIAAAAESGWDFSSRWLEDGQSLHTAYTSELLPVDLNSIMYRFEANMQRLSLMVGDEGGAASFGAAAHRRQLAMREVMWDEARRQWLDVQWRSGTPASPRMTTAANWLPLWAGCFDARQARLSTDSLRRSGLLQRGGVATTLTPSAHQWDWPNAWAPLQEMLVEGLERTQRADAHELALLIGRRWISSNLRAWRRTHFMYEKYSSLEAGIGGGGGEYTPQVGFGWSNGVALSLLARYGDLLADELPRETTSTTHQLNTAEHKLLR